MTDKRDAPRGTGRLLFAAADTHADMAYCSGFLAPDPFLWYDTGSERGMIVTPLELGRARREARPGIRVRSLPEVTESWELGSARPDPPQLIAGLSRETGMQSWFVPDDFPLGLAQELRRRQLCIEVLKPFCPEREFKTTAERSWIAEGVRAAERGLEAALQVLREATVEPDHALQWRGDVLTAERLRGEIDAAIARLGGTACRTIVAAGKHGADPHNMGAGPIAAHRPIVIDIFPRIDRTGYWGDLTRTVVKGTAPDRVRRAHSAVFAAQLAAFDCIQAGRRASDIHEAAAATLARAGFETDSAATPPTGFFHGLGHGLGLDIHEAPRLSPDAANELRPGQVITVEPGLYYPQWGGVRLEDVIVVTEDGFENLTSAPKILEI